MPAARLSTEPGGAG